MSWAPMQKAPLAALLQKLSKLQLRLVELHAKQQVHRAMRQVKLAEAQAKKEHEDELGRRKSS